MVFVNLYCSFHEEYFGVKKEFVYEYNPSEINIDDPKYKTICCKCQELFSVTYDLNHLIKKNKLIGVSYKDIFTSLNFLFEKYCKDSDSFFNIAFDVEKLMSPKKIRSKSRKMYNKKKIRKKSKIFITL